MKLRKLIWLTLAGITFLLGTLGTVLPILPTVPLYLLTLLALTNSSERLRSRFIASQLYRKHLEPYKKAGGLTLRSKIVLIAWVTVQIAIASLIIGFRLLPQIVLWGLYLGFLGSMLFAVKTVDREKYLKYQKEYSESAERNTIEQ